MKKLLFLSGILIFFSLKCMQAPPAMQPSSEIQQLENAIKAKYNVNEINCYPALSKTRVRSQYMNRPLKDRSDHTPWVACLISGYKKILLTKLEYLKNVDQDLVRLMKEKHIKQIVLLTPVENTPIISKRTGRVIATAPEVIENEVIMYTPEKEREAWLLAKAMLEKAPTYLTGFLLDYSPEDIEFFDQLLAFGPTKESFVDWPQEKKEQFYNYEKKWETGEQKIIGKTVVRVPLEPAEIFKNNRKAAEQWLEENRKFTVQQLMQQVDQLIRQQGGSVQLKTYE